MPDREQIRLHALKNAYQHGGKADPKAVLSKVLAESPDLRKSAKDLLPVVNEVVEEVNSLGAAEIEEILRKEHPEALIAEKKEQRHGLPDLPGVTGKVVMRMAPSPSGPPLHVGHSRMAILNDEYVRKYGGELILRIEDTNPKNIDPSAYQQIPRDLAWLGVQFTSVVVQSDRMELYYDEARRLIRNGGMYVCSCGVQEFKEKRQKGGIACPPHRSLSARENEERFQEMLDGGFREGEAVAVVKTDLAHPNPSVRDWIAFRIIEREHPRQGRKYRVYPMMNFSVAVDDHHLGLTHVIRGGKDHLNNTEKQKYIFRYNDWPLPVYFHYGLIHIPNTVLKTSTIKKGIADGSYSGWDDVRLGTILALRKRGGYVPATFRRYWIESGLRESDAEFSWDIFNAMNKDSIDAATPRGGFFVPDPVMLKVEGLPECDVTIPPNHPPTNKSLGDKEIQDERIEGGRLCGCVRPGPGAGWQGLQAQGLLQCC